MNYWDDSFLLGPHGDNDIVFTTENHVLRRLLGQLDTLHDGDKARVAIESLRQGNDNFIKPWSHDNHTALVCLSKMYGLEYHRKFLWQNWWKRLHPRDIIFYAWAAEVPFMNLLLPISLFLSILSVWNTGTKNIDGVEVLATDGKLLTFLRINTFNLPLTKKISNYLVKKSLHHGLIYLLNTLKILIIPTMY